MTEVGFDYLSFESKKFSLLKRLMVADTQRFLYNNDRVSVYCCRTVVYTFPNFWTFLVKPGIKTLQMASLVFHRPSKPIRAQI